MRKLSLFQPKERQSDIKVEDDNESKASQPNKKKSGTNQRDLLAKAEENA